MNIKLVIDYGVIGFLAVMSVIAIAVAIERVRFYKEVNPNDYSAIQLYEVALTKHLHIIATIGSNAPYVGLLGTVMGIMYTFVSLGENSTGGNIPEIMTGLALALKATAAGLLAAIPAMVMYNFLHRKVTELMLIKEAMCEREKL